MDSSIFEVESNKLTPYNGCILIANPFMSDVYFGRSVVLVLEHNEEGSMGVILNRQYPFENTIDEVIKGMESAPKLTVFKGGPVNPLAVFFLHTFPGLKGSRLILDGLYVNGDLEYLKNYILEGNPTEGILRSYSGYCKWRAGQLENEIEHNYWLVSGIDKEKALTPHFRSLWKDSLNAMGGKYALWSHFPMFPELN